MTALIHVRGIHGLREERRPCVLLPGIRVLSPRVHLVRVKIQGEPAPRWVASERVAPGNA